MALLNVYYLLERDEDGTLIWMDDEVERLVGTRAIGSGTCLLTGQRDMEFDVPGDDDAAAAIERLRQHGYRVETR